MTSLEVALLLSSHRGLRHIHGLSSIISICLPHKEAVYLTILKPIRNVAQLQPSGETKQDITQRKRPSLTSCSLVHS